MLRAGILREIAITARRIRCAYAHAYTKYIMYRS